MSGIGWRHNKHSYISSTYDRIVDSMQDDPDAAGLCV